VFPPSLTARRVDPSSNRRKIKILVSRDLGSRHKIFTIAVLAAAVMLVGPVSGAATAGPYQNTVEHVSADAAAAAAAAAGAKMKVVPNLMGKTARGAAPSAPATSAAPALSASQRQAVSAATGHLTVGQGVSNRGLIDQHGFALCQQVHTGSGGRGRCPGRSVRQTADAEEESSGHAVVTDLHGTFVS
jgi:hypothetical protein